MANISFDIAAKTFRLKKASSIEDSPDYLKYDLLDGNTTYVVPVYQREYLWDTEQISRFIMDLFKGFWQITEDEDGHIIADIIEEPFFIGTMQLSRKRLSSDRYEQDIIDGQQRISTLLCLFKYLSLFYSKDFIPLDWLKTRVNNGKEQEYLEAFLKVNDLSAIVKDSGNSYIRNCAIIGDYFQESMDGEAGIFDIDRFITYILDKVYFVAVETNAGLSKTIQIFNVINTTGLDLSGDDLFKVRFYEYLRDICNKDEQVFNEIGAMYKRIKDINAAWRDSGHDYDVVSIGSVRSAYKDYLISVFDMPNGLYPMATDTFFEYLFDDLLGVEHHPEIGDKARKQAIVLSLDDLNKVVDVVAEWNKSEYQSYEQLIAYKLIDKSRYSRYTRIVYLLMMKGYGLKDVYDILLPLAKVYFCYSIYYARIVYDIRTFTYRLQKRIASSMSKEAVLDFIDQKLFSEECKGWSYCFRQQIANNRVKKDLICCLSAYFDEKQAQTPLDKLERLLSRDYDIEHIHATLDTSVDVQPEYQNSIGNLMLLEYSINRSLGKKKFDIKKKSYKDSEYVSIRSLVNHTKWDQTDIESRLENEYKKICDFIWNKGE